MLVFGTLDVLLIKVKIQYCASAAYRFSLSLNI